MPVNRRNIGGLVLNAWNDARHAVVGGSDRQDANRKKSTNWVDALAKRFQEHYEGGRYRLFWSGNRGNQKHFGRNELLFDLAVCSVSTTKSLEKEARDLEFIAQCHWQIESEFSHRTRDIIVDMSKLVMGSAENKLFVAAHRGDREEDILERCLGIAGLCTGRVYFCFVSHPDHWTTKPERPALYEWITSGWAHVALPQEAVSGENAGR